MSEAPAHAYPADLVELSASIIMAYVAHNSVPSGELPALLTTVHAALTRLGLGHSEAPASEAPAKPTPAQIKKSITPDAIISFEDGKPYKSMRRHLSTRGLTPEAYRAKWSLPSDYPIVAASYSAARSELARSIGLGNKQRGESTATEVQPVEAVPVPPKKAGRPRKIAA